MRLSLPYISDIDATLADTLDEFVMSDIGVLMR